MLNKCQRLNLSLVSFKITKIFFMKYIVSICLIILTVNAFINCRTDKANLYQSIDTSSILSNSDEIKPYFQKYAATALQEQQLYKIPATVILAQGFLESGQGTSKLASLHNNHFGIKCFEKRCDKGHCKKALDAGEGRYSRFRSYKSAWWSYRHHSKLLSNKRYSRCRKLDISNYKGWSICLQKSGYASDKNYSKKLINIIESQNLQKICR